MVYKALNMTLSFFYGCPFSKTREYISYVIRTKPHQSVMNKTGKYLIFFSFFHILYLFLFLANEREILHEHEHEHTNNIYNSSTLLSMYSKKTLNTHTDRPNTFETVICFAQSNSKIHMVIVSWGTSKECVCVCVHTYIQQIS